MKVKSRVWCSHTHTLFPHRVQYTGQCCREILNFAVREGVGGRECVFVCRFVYLVACSIDCINLCRHCLGVSVKKWKLRQVTRVKLGISIIFVMDFLVCASQSALIASDERCYKSAKCYYKGEVFFLLKKGFIYLFLKCRISLLEGIFKAFPGDLTIWFPLPFGWEPGIKHHAHGEMVFQLTAAFRVVMSN